MKLSVTSLAEVAIDAFLEGKGFDKLVKELKKQGAEDPKALAGWIVSRKKKKDK